MKRIYILSLLSVLLFSCNKEEIPTYSGAYYVNFLKDTTETIKFSFITRPGTNSAVIGLPIELIGFKPQNDIPYTVKVVTDGVNASTATAADFSIPTTPVFRASHYVDKKVVDTLYVTLNKTDILNTKELKLTLKIEDGSVALQGLQKNIFNVVMFGNIRSRPNWWTDSFATAFLGTYSDRKYDEFIKSVLEINPTFDFEDMETMSNSDYQAYSRNFVYYLRRLKDEGREVMEEDGVTPMLNGINVIA